MYRRAHKKFNGSNRRRKAFRRKRKSSYKKSKGPAVTHMRACNVRMISQDHNSTKPINFRFNLMDALHAKQKTYVQMHRWYKVTGIKIEAFPGQNICGGVQALGPVDFTDDPEGNERREYNYPASSESAPSCRPIYCLWTPDIDTGITSGVTHAYLEACPQARQYSSLEPIVMYRKIKVPIYVKSDVSTNVLVQRAGLIDTSDTNLTLGQLFMGIGSINASTRQAYIAHVRVTYYVQLFGRRYI